MQRWVAESNVLRQVVDINLIFAEHQDVESCIISPQSIVGVENFVTCVRMMICQANNQNSASEISSPGPIFVLLIERQTSRLYLRSHR